MASNIKLKNNINSEFTVTHEDNQGAILVSSTDLAKVVSVDTIADLRATTKSQPTVWVSGYYEKGDGAFGSNIFEWDSVSTENDNGGTIIKLDSVATGRYKLRYSGSVNVKWFGAKGDCDASTTVGDANYANPEGTDNYESFQNAIDAATALNTNIFIPASDKWYKIHADALTVTCGITGESMSGSRLKFTDDGLSIRYSLEITGVSNAIFENFTYDCSVSADPVDWNNNYNNFTGRRGMRSIGSGDNQVFRNINTTNTFQAGLAFYDGSTKVIIDNMSVTRCRGNFGDGLYLSGNKKKVKITNCKVYDFTRIGLVTDSPYGNIIEDCVVDNCTFEYGHNYSALHGGGEFNSGVWLENTARSIIKNCTSKNIIGRGFTVTTGDDSLTIANYSECYSVLESCVAENTGSGFILGQLGLNKANHRVVNCSAILCTVQDITGSTSTSGENNIFITNFFSEKSFSGSQARCLAFGAGLDGIVNVIVDGFKVKSDFNSDTFTYSGNGHISENSNNGTVNYTIRNFKDKNGVVIDKDSGASTGVTILENINNLYAHHITTEDLIVYNCVFKKYGSSFSPLNTSKYYNCVFDCSVGTTTNTDIVFDNCEFRVPIDGRVWIANNYASVDEPNKIVARFLNCNFYKDFSGSTPYALQFSVKSNPNKTGLFISGCFFYNTSDAGVGAYAVYFNSGYSSFLGSNNYLDNTVEYTYKNFSTPSSNETVISKMALQ